MGNEPVNRRDDGSSRTVQPGVSGKNKQARIAQAEKMRSRQILRGGGRWHQSSTRTKKTAVSRVSPTICKWKGGWAQRDRVLKKARFDCHFEITR